MAVVATQIKKGQCINYQGERGVILDIEHRTPGKGNALIMATIRSFQSGKTKAIRFASGEKVEVVSADRQVLEFNYREGDSFHFMHPQSFEMVELSLALIGEDQVDFLVENTACDVLFIENEPVSVELPATINLKVSEAPEGLKGDTANNPQKAITLETGKIIQAPLFIKIGDTIKVDTRTGKYLGRA